MGQLFQWPISKRTGAGSGRILVLLPGAHLRPLALGKNPDLTVAAGPPPLDFALGRCGCAHPNWNRTGNGAAQIGHKPLAQPTRGRGVGVGQHHHGNGKLHPGKDNALEKMVDADWTIIAGVDDGTVARMLLLFYVVSPQFFNTFRAYTVCFINLT